LLFSNYNKGIENTRFMGLLSLRKQASKKDFMRRPCHSSRIPEQEEEMGLAN